MRDARLDKLADVLVNYSVAVKPGQLVRISGSPCAQALIEALYERVLKAGAHPLVRVGLDGIEEIFFKNASDEQLAYLPPMALEEIKTIDASIGLWSEFNTKELSSVDPKKQGKASAARKPIMEVFMKRAASGELRWTGTLFPTVSSAQDAEMGLHEYEDFVFEAGHLGKPDPVAVWKEIHERQQRVVDYLTGKKVVRFQAKNATDLTVNVEGMTWINCSGRENFPDGEVFTGPNLKAADGGVNGVVRYHFPAVYHGREVEDVELVFEKGRVVKASASKNQDFLTAMLDQDEGARGLGEIAIGTNYQIQRFTKNTLFDEKIGGTFHAAVGAGYPESGNSNESALHWDMVCDLRPGGTITVDGEVISRDGKFVFDGWPGR
ncbi:MAG: aminopeptidase [Planctomycetes bacterium]|nr:aminopeptidase [Planctomycetota bacterium]